LTDCGLLFIGEASSYRFFRPIIISYGVSFLLRSLDVGGQNSFILIL